MPWNYNCTLGIKICQQLCTELQAVKGPFSSVGWVILHSKCTTHVWHGTQQDHNLHNMPMNGLPPCIHTVHLH